MFNNGNKIAMLINTRSVMITVSTYKITYFLITFYQIYPSLIQTQCLFEYNTDQVIGITFYLNTNKNVPEYQNIHVLHPNHHGKTINETLIP